MEEIRENPGQWRAYNAERHCVVLAGPGSGKTKTLTVKIAKLLIETIREPRGLACITYNTECARDWQEDEQLAGLITRYEALLRENGFIDFDDMVLIGLQLIESHRWIRKALRAKFPVIVVDEYQDLGVSLHRIIEQLCFRAGSRLFAVGDPDQSIYGFTGARPELLRQLAASERVESVTLPFNYRSGPTIVRASEIVLGEERGYQARGAGMGTVDFHERPAGLEDQAEYICGELIPDALARIEGLRLGDIAVLYLDKNDGDVIAEAAGANGYPTIRIDRGAPYPRTPLTRWLETCAAWCAGGWRSGKPRLSAILADWASISKIYRSSDPRAHPQKVGLLRFLLSHRNPDLLLSEWLTAFRIDCLDPVLESDATLRDERETLGKVIEASVADGPLAAWTLMMFGGQGGSPDHLNLITLHSAKGLEFKVVIMMGMDQGRIPHWSAGELGKREPRRLFYVGLTRAKDEVHMTYSGWTQNRYGRRFDRGPSEFLAEVRDRLRQTDN